MTRPITTDRCVLHICVLISCSPFTAAFTPMPSLSFQRIAPVSRGYRKHSFACCAPWQLHNYAIRQRPRKSEEKGEDRPLTNRDRLVTLMDHFWYGATSVFPGSLRRLSKKRSRDVKQISLGFKEGIAALLAYLATGVVSYHCFFEKWSIIDSLYFTCVCFSTVGYGDLTPLTPEGKIFSCVFGFIGIALLGAVVANIGTTLVQTEIEEAEASRRQFQKGLHAMQVQDSMPDNTQFLHNSEVNLDDEETATRDLSLTIKRRFGAGLTSFWKGARWLSKSLFLIAAEGLLVGRIEGWPWQNSIYYALITASTIGFGDFAPVTSSGRLAAVVAIPVTVAAAGEVLASVGLAMVRRRQKQIFDNQLERGLTRDHLEAMDSDGNGKVDREEYVLFMLMEMGLVNEKEVKELQAQFDKLDVTNSGDLDNEDLLLMAQRRKRKLVSQKSL